MNYLNEAIIHSMFGFVSLVLGRLITQSFQGATGLPEGMTMLKLRMAQEILIQLQTDKRWVQSLNQPTE
jgi:hypothetical protein